MMSPGRPDGVLQSDEPGERFFQQFEILRAVVRLHGQAQVQFSACRGHGSFYTFPPQSAGELPGGIVATFPAERYGSERQFRLSRITQVFKSGLEQRGVALAQLREREP